MKARIAPLLVGLAALHATHTEAATYQIDPSHSFVLAEVDHFNTSTLQVRFGPLQGTVELDRDTGRGKLGLRIATTGLSTGFAPFDARLREGDLLSTAEHPEAYFVAERFVFEGRELREVRGEFTLRGVSQPLSLRALRFNCYLNPLFRREVCGGDFAGEIQRSDFGATFGLPFIGNTTRLRVQVEGIRQPE